LQMVSATAFNREHNAVWVPAQGRDDVWMGPACANYADAVVTPPSTTMVWPVMKLEASEPR
jgi:hypothetical protein